MNSDEYSIKFSIKYQTKLGEIISIYGDIPELGAWKQPKFKLKWTEGHVWKGQLTLPSNIDRFQFKFVCESDDHKIQRWEEGMNRIFLMSKCSEGEIKDRSIKLDCVWEHFYVVFNIYYPLENDVEYLQIVGKPKELGSWLVDGGIPAKMHLSEKKTLKSKGLIYNKT
jgi:hypothetical protein